MQMELKIGNRGKAASLLLAACLAVGAAMPNGSIAEAGSTAATAYTDVKVGAWYEASVIWAGEKRILNGFPDGTFRPNAKIAEAEFVALLLRSVDVGSVREAASGENWTIPYYERVAELGLPASPADRTQPIRRALAARLIAAAIGQPSDEASAIRFVLETKLSNGRTSATVQGFEASASLSRAEAIVLIQRVYRYWESVKETDGESTGESPSGEEAEEGAGSGIPSSPSGPEPTSPPGPERPEDPNAAEDNLQERTQRLQERAEALGLQVVETAQGLAFLHPQADRGGSGAILTQNASRSGYVRILDVSDDAVLSSAHALLEFAGASLDLNAFLELVAQVKSSGRNSALKIGSQLFTFVRNATPGELTVNYVLG